MESGAAILMDDILNSDKKVILTWRNPIEAVISQFYFYQQYSHFGVPTNISDYAKSNYLQNSQIHFLTRNKFLDKSSVTELDYCKIIQLLERKNTFVFSVDYFNESVYNES